MTIPVAVLISDIHFTPSTLNLASMSLRLARAKAWELKVPLIIAGDTLDSKAIMRAECVNALIGIFTEQFPPPETYILVGNHDLLNEKGTAHSLEFLKPYVKVIDKPTFVNNSMLLVPYQSDLNSFRSILRNSSSKLIICHQGLTNAYMGHYMQDPTALSSEDVSDYRIISGHYHRRQDIKCGRPRKDAVGLFSYIGNPYTLTFGESEDPEKGFQILHDRGLLEFVPTNFRKHRVFQKLFDDLELPIVVQPDDILKLKLSGTRSQLLSVNKKEMGLKLFGHDHYKLDLIELENDTVVENTNNMTDIDLFDKLIDNIQEDPAYKSHLKSFWKESLRENS